MNFQSFKENTNTYIYTKILNFYIENIFYEILNIDENEIFFSLSFSLSFSLWNHKYFDNTYSYDKFWKENT